MSFSNKDMYDAGAGMLGIEVCLFAASNPIGWAVGASVFIIWGPTLIYGAVNDKQMFKWYYILWSDAINFTRSKSKFIGVWKLYTLGVISCCMAINLAIINAVSGLKITTHFISIFNLKSLDNFLGFMFVFYLPPLIINYIFIFSRSQWEDIRKKYKHYNGKVYKIYFIISIALPISLLIILKVLHDLFGFSF